MAIEPTPPVAPVTTTGPMSGRWPFSSIRWIASAAVKPAVPSSIALRSVRPSGSGTSQSAGSRSFPAKPPSCASPRPMPFARTGVPGG